jgi:hypothetical protein
MAEGRTCSEMSRLRLSSSAASKLAARGRMEALVNRIRDNIFGSKHGPAKQKGIPGKLRQPIFNLSPASLYCLISQAQGDSAYSRASRVRAQADLLEI